MRTLTLEMMIILMMIYDWMKCSCVGIEVVLTKYFSWAFLL